MDVIVNYCVRNSWLVNLSRGFPKWSVGITNILTRPPKRVVWLRNWVIHFIKKCFIKIKYSSVGRKSINNNLLLVLSMYSEFIFKPTI